MVRRTTLLYAIDFLSARTVEDAGPYRFVGVFSFLRRFLIFQNHRGIHYKSLPVQTPRLGAGTARTPVPTGLWVVFRFCADFGYNITIGGYTNNFCLYKHRDWKRALPAGNLPPIRSLHGMRFVGKTFEKVFPTPLQKTSRKVVF